jgi:hypothetical protein
MRSKTAFLFRHVSIKKHDSSYLTKTAAVLYHISCAGKKAQVAEGFPSGQRGQTVNLLSLTSMVQIHPPPPKKPGCLTSRLFRIYASLFAYQRDYDAFDILFVLRLCNIVIQRPGLDVLHGLIRSQQANRSQGLHLKHLVVRIGLI